ncbi:MAG: hypothetical protein Q9N02_10065 [Ghiorsea sp.]|nr:hypothetical protein [Ghiorsea sp.]
MSDYSALILGASFCRMMGKHCDSPIDLPSVKQACAGGKPSPYACENWRHDYRELLKKTKTECPTPDSALHKGKRGR